MLPYWIWLANKRSLSNYHKSMVLEHFGTPEAVFLADETLMRELEYLNSAALADLMDKDLSEAEKILRVCDNKRISILTWTDAAYPARLRNIADPPILLYYEGRIPNVDHTATIGVVGTRKASVYGLKNAKELGYQLGKAGAIVVSGSAAGVDTLCLEGALTAGNPVISVLGNGTDVVYPKSNRRLYEDIRRNGCLLSEYPPGTQALGGNFPVRNRIISGLSCGVVVVEAPAASGALITARRALEQGRDIFTFPANVGIDAFKGNIQLLKDGAIPIEDGSDVLKEYQGLFPVLTDKIGADFEVSEGKTHEKKKKEASDADKKSVDKKNEGNYIDLKEVLSDVSQDGAAVLLALKNGSLHVDEVIEKSGMPANRVSVAMTVLLIKKYVLKLPGQRFQLADHIKAGELNE